MKMMMKVRVQPRRGLDYSCIRHPQNLHGVYAPMELGLGPIATGQKKRTKQGDGTKITELNVYPHIIAKSFQEGVRL